MSSPVSSILAPGATPPWLPREVAEGRKFAWWAQVMFFLMALVWFVLAITFMVLYFVDGGNGRIAVGVFGLFAMVICFMSGVFEKRTVIDAIDQGRFHDAKNDSLIWVLFGLVGFVLPTLFLMLTYVKISDAIAAQAPVGYQPYAPGTVAVQQPAYVPPPSAQAPPPAPIQQVPPPAQAHHGHQTPMMRCKNCNVQYPMFMHSCPNCGAPKE